MVKGYEFAYNIRTTDASDADIENTSCDSSREYLQQINGISTEWKQRIRF
jgi:hypothetical protein